MSVGETGPTRFSREAQFNQNAGGNVHGDTYSANDSQQLMGQYEALFGPAGRDIKVDSQRNKRHQRWHLPDSLKGYNSFLTDRIDGLITDATSSPFTRNILPYFYLENPDAKIKWNVYSFDEGMASRVPYESAARVLTQTKSSQSGYAIRQGLAIAMEHNFLASDAGRDNFKHQLTQLVGSIQLTNDLDVHIALLQAQSYEKIVSEKYYGTERTLQRTGKQYCDMFGIYNKMPNALDLLIEEARTKLKTWGSEPPTFLLCPSNLTLHMTMSPERTNYITNGPDGLKRLAQGPDLPAFRGLNIIHSQKFSLEAGREPRNVLRRKVRVAEYYWLPHEDTKTGDYSYELYDQSTDSFKSFTKSELIKKSGIEAYMKDAWQDAGAAPRPNVHMTDYDFRKCDVLLLRPNIEHEMLSVIIGRGGTQELGSTFWGQTELACYDDAQHGIWGMSYKYHERAIVTNERNLIRMFDVAFDGYNGGMACDIMPWTPAGITEFKRDTEGIDGPYRGKSIVVLAFPTIRVKEKYLSVQILSAPALAAAVVRDNAGVPFDPPLPQHPADDNPRLDLERVLRKISGANPLSWDKSDRLLDSLLLDRKDEFVKLQTFANARFAAANRNAWTVEEWSNHPLDGNAYICDMGPEDNPAEKNVASDTEFITYISQQIDHLHAINGMTFEHTSELFLYCIASVLVRYLMESVYSTSSTQYVAASNFNTRLDQLINAGNQMNSGLLIAIVTELRTATNIDCTRLMHALFHSRRADSWDWLDYLHRMADRNGVNAPEDIPNPLILPTMFAPEHDGPVFVDSESTVPISDSQRYSLSHFLINNMTKNVYSGNADANELYKRYTEQLESMFQTQVNIQPGENIRSNTTQIPTLCYHGNMKIKQHSTGAVLQEMKCIGHMGNSYPGMASVREGRGVQSMNAPAGIMHLQ
jgi:hypothetical protein